MPPVEQEFTRGASLTQDLKEAMNLVNKGEFTGPIASAGGFKVGTTHATAFGGAYTVLAADAAANLANISTGLTTVNGFSVMVLRAGVNVTSDAVITKQANGVIRVADGATYNTTTNDVIHWTAVGVK